MASTELAQWDAKLAEMAEQYASVEKAGGEFLSVKGGVLTFDGEPLPGNQMVVIILDVVKERTFYTKKYDASAEHNSPPVCYAFGRTDEEMAPHPSMQVDLSYFVPQSDVCATCPNNEWGSSDTGRGKACGERRRMALLPAGYYAAKRGSRDFDLHLFTEMEHYQSADIAYLKLPVTSVKEYARYTTQLASQHRRPPMGAVTRMYVEPDPQSQFKVKFEMIELLPAEMFEPIMARHEEAKAGIIFGYSPPSAEARQGNGGRSARR